jgi:Ca2+-binding EF-hand superfamily protein
MTPEQFKSELDLFDEDRNGCAQIEDVNRVLQTYTDMSEADRQLFVKICQFGPNLSEQQIKASLKELNLPRGFNIKHALQSLFNV